MTKEFAEALLAAQKAMKAVKKSGYNPHFKSNFAQLEDVNDEVKETLNAHGIHVSQSSAAVFDGGTLFGLDVVTTLLFAQTGEERHYPCFISGKPQESGSQNSYGRRYGMCAANAIVGEKDDDAEAATAPSRKPALAAVPSEPSPKGKPTTQAEKTTLDVFYPRTDEAWVTYIGKIKSQADCRTAKQALLLYCNGEDTHSLYKKLEERYGALGQKATGG